MGILGGVLLCSSVLQSHKGAPWVGSYSVFQFIKHLMGQPLYCSAANAGVWGEAMVMAPSSMHDSAVSPCFHGCLAFLYWHFPPQSPLPHPLNPSLRSQQQPSPWNCPQIPKLQLPDAVLRGLSFLLRVCLAATRTVLFSFHLGCHRSAV